MEITKTTEMRLIEALDPEGRDIRAIIQSLVDETGTVREAAGRLEMDPSALSKWIDRLGGNVRSRVIFPEREPAEAVAR